MPDAPTTAVAESIVASRQLIAQSKRLMLTSIERRARLRGGEALRKRAERIRDETANAHRIYRAAVLTWGQTTSLEFLANLAEALVFQLRDGLGGQSARDQLDLAIEIESLQILIEQWRLNGRPAVASAA
ncbi:MAG: hypothetical protein E6J40_03880 [Chloroflexi bacterium]|nr:MAG: hypothetical protein E6J40_03880 [Chloroflexota bacterium]